MRNKDLTSLIDDAMDAKDVFCVIVDVSSETILAF